MENFPIVVRIFILGIWMLAVPLLAGGVFAGKSLRAVGADGRAGRMIFCWCSGQMLLWAGFQLICVPMILRERSFHDVLVYFVAYSGVAVFGGILRKAFSGRGNRGLRPVEEKRATSAGERALWGIFAGLLLVQLACALGMAYEEGDDAYYVAVSTITNSADTMYNVLPYTGGLTGMDARHALAPMPIWIAFLARVTGIPSVSVAQVAAPVVLIAMAYGIFYLVGASLFGRKGVKCPLFMVLMELFVLFGGYSVYSAENFMIVRTAQGKAVLASIIVPYMLLVMTAVLKRLPHTEKVEARWWILLLAAVLAACLCSTQGAILTGVLFGVTGFCAAVRYRRWRFLAPMACCCIPAVGYLLLYIRLG